MPGKSKPGRPVAFRLVANHFSTPYSSLRRIGELHAHGGRNAKAQRACGRKVEAPRTVEPNALPEGLGVGCRFVDDDRLLRFDFIQHVEHGLGAEWHGPVGRWLGSRPWLGQLPLRKRDGSGQLAQQELRIGDNGLSHGGARSFGGISSDGVELRPFGQL